MLEPPRTSASAPYTPCSLCDGVVRVGSRRFANQLQWEENQLQEGANQLEKACRVLLH